VNDVSIFTFSQPNVNGANADVMASVGQYTDAQRQHINDYLAGTGQYAQQGMQWFTSAATLANVAGLGGNAAPFGTTISALRINITVHEGRSQFRLSTVLAPQGGATTNQTAATNATAAASTTSATTSTSVTNTAQPSSTANSATAAAAASQSINYPYTLLEMVEDDEIPQNPPEVPQT
jgi:general secretion pathway protein K